MSWRAKASGREGPVTADRVVDAAVRPHRRGGARGAHHAPAGAQPGRRARDHLPAAPQQGGPSWPVWPSRAVARGGRGRPAGEGRGAARCRGWREQIRAMWTGAVRGDAAHTPTPSLIIAPRRRLLAERRGGHRRACCASSSDAGLSPQEAAELLHILSACVVGFGFATPVGPAGRGRPGGRRGRARRGEPAVRRRSRERPAHRLTADDLADYRAATRSGTRRSSPRALDIVLARTGTRWR